MATKQNLYIDLGTTYLQSFYLKNTDNTPLDLSGFTGRSQIRKEYTSNTYNSFDVSVGGNTGIVTISLAANTSSNIESGRYLYDIELESNTGTVTRILEGFVTFTPEVTR